ncbi:MAG: phage portal protein [Acutalibacteraceae bacterium]
MPFFDNLRRNATAVRNAFVQPSTSPGDESLMEFLGIQTTGKRPQNDVTYYICLKKKAETLGSMPLKFYQKSEGKIETAKKDDMAVLLTERPNPYMTPATFWSSVSANLDHYGNAYVVGAARFYPAEVWRLP